MTAIPDGVTTLSICVIVAFIRLTIIGLRCMYIVYIDWEKANGEDMVERWIPLCENIGYNTIITH